MGLRDQTDNLSKNICNLCLCVRFGGCVCSMIDSVPLAESVGLQVINLVVYIIRKQEAL